MAVLGLHSGEVDAEVSNDNVYVFSGNPDGLGGECQHFAPNAGRAVKVQSLGIKVSVFLPSVCEEENAENHTLVMGSCDIQVTSRWSTT